MKYRYVTSLSPIEVMARIRCGAKPTHAGWRYTEYTLFYKIMDHANFMLMHTGFGGSHHGQPCFWGKLTVENSQTILTGQFAPPKSRLWMGALFALLSGMFAFRTGGFQMFLVMLPLSILLVVLVFKMVFGASSLEDENSQKVLEFIETYLIENGEEKLL